MMLPLVHRMLGFPEGSYPNCTSFSQGQLRQIGTVGYPNPVRPAKRHATFRYPLLSLQCARTKGLECYGIPKWQLRRFPVVLMRLYCFRRRYNGIEPRI